LQIVQRIAAHFSASYTSDGIRHALPVDRSTFRNQRVWRLPNFLLSESELFELVLDFDESMREAPAEIFSALGGLTLFVRLLALSLLGRDAKLNRLRQVWR
jgi:hypothetical protein